MRESRTDSFQVHAELDGATVLVGGVSFAGPRPRGISARFTYDPRWASRNGSFDLGPQLPRGVVDHTLRGIPYALDDTAPDTFGRRLIRRAWLAQGRDRAPDDIDMILGVSDRTRQGALRYTIDGLQFESAEGAVPHLVALPDLEAAALAVAEGRADDHDVMLLVAGGTASLGGARPKAAVLGASGALAIAKFTDTSDTWDVIGWEYLALELAERAGIPVPARELREVGRRRALIVDRFDRSGTRRIPYLSARTLLQSDEVAGDYVEIAEALRDLAIADLGAARRDLFARVALSVAINNTDDHLKNHGFLLGHQGWNLSPVFDINPNLVGGTSRATSIDGGDHPAAASRGLRGLAVEMRLTDDELRDAIDRVVDAVQSWPTLARAIALEPSEMLDFERVITAGLASLAEVRPAASSRPTGMDARTQPRAE